MAPRWEQVEINARGGVVHAIAPAIISASRATDIPAFYGDWLVRRLEAGYAKWINPFNGRSQYVSFEKTRAIVFWSKYPQPMFRFIDRIEEKGINYYFTITLNDYEDERLEPHLPPLDRRISAFKKLSERIGKSRTIWRFDPLVLLEGVGIDGLLEKVRRVGDRIHAHTEKLVISFARVGTYKKVARKMADTAYRDFDVQEMERMAEGLRRLNESWGLDLAACAEGEDFSQFGILRNSCVDGELMVRLFPGDRALMDFLGAASSETTTAPRGILPGKSEELLVSTAPGTDAVGLNRRLKDSGQREDCGCIASKDIGRYDTCMYLCRYCYANGDDAIVTRNYCEYRRGHNARL